MATKKNKGRKGKSPQRAAYNLRTTVSPGVLQRLIRVEEEYNASLELPVYPDPERFEELAGNLAAIKEAGFVGLVSMQQIMAGADTGFGDFFGAKRSRKGKKSKGKGQHALPNPNDVHTVVMDYLDKPTRAPLKVVGYDGPQVLGGFNFEFLTLSKAKYFLKTYVELVKRFHVLACVEVEDAGVAEIGKAAGYGYFTCATNNSIRNAQQVGFLVHPRFELVGAPRSDWAVATIQGIPSLRPAFTIKLRDKTTGEEDEYTVVHLKSMRGGPASTAPVRFQQCQQIVKTVKQGFLLGDFNTFLNNTKDTSPLTSAGWSLFRPGDSTSTQSMGGRLDGIFFLSINGKLTYYQIRAIFKNKVFGRGFSDHGVYSARRHSCGTKDPSCSTVQDNASDPVEVTP